MSTEMTEQRTPRWVFVGSDGLRAGWGALAFMALAVAILVPLQFAVRPLIRRVMAATGNHGSPLGMVLQESLLVLASLGATAVMARIEGRRFTAYGLSRERLPARLMAGALVGFIALSALVGLLWITGNLTFNGVNEHGAAAWQYAVMWGIAALLVGLFEETLFRGYLLTTLTRGVGFWPAAALLGLLFGLAHTGNTGEAKIGIIAAVVAGFVFAIAIWRSGSLWWMIGFHAAWDWAESFFYGTADSGGVAPHHFLNTQPQGATWLSGGSVGPEGSVFVFLILLALIPVIFLTLRPPPNRDTGRLPRDVERRDPRAGGQVDGIDGAGIGAD